MFEHSQTAAHNFNTAITIIGFSFGYFLSLTSVNSAGFLRIFLRKHVFPTHDGDIATLKFHQSMLFGKKPGNSISNLPNLGNRLRAHTWEIGPSVSLLDYQIIPDDGVTYRGSAVYCSKDHTLTSLTSLLDGTTQNLRRLYNQRPWEMKYWLASRCRYRDGKSRPRNAACWEHRRLMVSRGDVTSAVCRYSSCPGPTQYYSDVGCTPVFNNSHSHSCPVKYNCDFLNNLPIDKCFVNGHEYAIGEILKEDDSNPCDIGCTCAKGLRGATFTCAVVDCFHGPVKPGCYRKNSPLNCCPDEEVCPENPEDRPTCTVDGKVYKDGEYFEVPSEPDMNCVCNEGYKGENIEPFCALPKHSYCSPLFRHAGDVREKCAPVYYSNQSPQTSCSVFSRCQNDKDVVITQESATSEPADSDDMMCTFGNLTMRVGDELNQATDYSSVCVKCVCEVPPVPTCQRLPDEKCDVTQHPPFDNDNY